MLAALIAFLPLVPASAGSGDGHHAALTVDDVERLFVPVCTGGAAGRLGSHWGCEMWVRNSADVPVVFAPGTPFSSLPGGGVNRIDAHRTMLEFGTGGLVSGAIYVVEKAHADKIHVSVRIGDRNRRPLSQGTSVPVIRERDWPRDPVELLDIPTDPAVRATLRVYDLDAMKGSVLVTIHPLRENDTLAEVVLDLSGDTNRNLDPVWYQFPDLGEIADLVSTFPQIGMHERLRVRVEPLTPGMRFWAFVAITDNMTQHVTVVTPR